MAWREIVHEDQLWRVDALAERRAEERSWQLILAFRSRANQAPKVLWAPYPLEATSKLSLFLQAGRITDAALSHLLAERLR